MNAATQIGSATAINMKYDSMHELKTDKSRLSVNSYSLFFPNSSHKYLTSFDSIKVRLEKHQLLPSINDITNNKIHIDKFDPKAEQMKPVHFKPFTISIGNCNTKPNTITPVKVDNTNESKKKDTLKHMKVDVIKPSKSQLICSTQKKAYSIKPESIKAKIIDKENASGDDIKHVNSLKTNARLPSSKPVQFMNEKNTIPYFFIAGRNGANLVEAFFLALGWRRTFDKWRRDCKIRWCEVKTFDYYRYLHEGEQLCYQIPNNGVLTTKIGLLTSLQDYDRFSPQAIKKSVGFLNYKDFFPETYRLDLSTERIIFLSVFSDNEVWISKPTGLNQGKGIYLLRSRADLAKIETIHTKSLKISLSRKCTVKFPMARIVQRYIEKPLLLNRRKFDVRNYLLVACVKPMIVFYADGYCRLTCGPYDRDNPNLIGHLTNQYMQKKSPLYLQSKEDTVWSMDQFNSYFNEHICKENKKVPAKNWVHNALKKRCQEIMLHCFKSVKAKLKRRLGYFDLLGCDFLVDEKFKVFLLEMNSNPALHTNCKALKEIIPGLVHEALELTLEIFEKVCNGRSVLPLVNQKKFVLLFNEEEESMKFTLKDRKKVKAKKASPKKSPKPSEKTSC